MRALCCAALLVCLGCRSEDNSSKSQTGKASGFDKPNHPPLRVTAAVRKVMPLVPRSHVLVAHRPDKLGRGFELHMCSGQTPAKAARALQTRYAKIGWRLRLQRGPSQGGWRVVGSNGTLVLSAFTRGRDRISPANTGASCAEKARPTLIVVTVRNTRQSTLAWKRAAINAQRPSRRTRKNPLTCPPNTHPSPFRGFTAWCETAKGVKHGPFAWFNGGKKSLTGVYRDGLYHGSFEAYADGKVVKKFKMVDGTGTIVLFHTAKIKRSELGYRKGKKHGTWTYWHANGKMRFRANYDNGWEHGLRQGWDRKGVRRNENHSHQGRMHGLTRIWNAAGKLVREIHYVHGRSVKEIRYIKGKRTVKNRPLPTYKGKIVTRSHPKLKAEWQACKRHDECVSIPKNCCACSASDRVAVHYKLRETARKKVLPSGACRNTKCPSMKCARTGVRCEQRSCVSTDL